MTNENFVFSLELQKGIVDRKNTITKEKINWFHARSLEYRKYQLFSIFMEYDNQTVEQINIKNGTPAKNNSRTLTYHYCILLEIP